MSFLLSFPVILSFFSVIKIIYIDEDKNENPLSIIKFITTIWFLKIMFFKRQRGSMLMVVDSLDFDYEEIYTYT